MGLKGRKRNFKKTKKVIIAMIMVKIDIAKTREWVYNINTITKMSSEDCYYEIFSHV